MHVYVYTSWSTHLCSVKGHNFAFIAMIIETMFLWGLVSKQKLNKEVNAYDFLLVITYIINVNTNSTFNEMSTLYN